MNTDSSDQGQAQNIPGLSPAAQKVYPELIEAGKKMRKSREEVKGGSVVTVGNKITDKAKESGPGDVIDFDITVAAAKSELVQDPEITPEKRNIRRRFMDKVRKNVVGDRGVI